MPDNDNVENLRERRIEANLAELRALRTERLDRMLAGELACPGLELELEKKMSGTGNEITLTLRASAEVTARADGLIDRVHGPIIMALTGGRVSRSMVLRMALMEGLAVLEERFPATAKGGDNAR